MNFENDICKLEINDKMELEDKIEQIEELKNIKNELFNEEFNQLLSLGRDEMIESAIDLTDNKEKLENWKKKLLEDNSEDDPKVKELVLKMKINK